MLTELNQVGAMYTAMLKLTHYFTPFQTYLIQEAEREDGRFDILTALSVLKAEADLRATEPSPLALFFFQFETLCRHRLRYDYGISSMALDPMFEPSWQEWIKSIRRKIGTVGIADLVYIHSEYYAQKQEQAGQTEEIPAILFGFKEGRIALANRSKEPLHLFSSLQRHLNYPSVPRPKPKDEADELVPRLLRQVERLDLRVKLLEDEQREGTFDLTKFYKDPNNPQNDLE